MKVILFFKKCIAADIIQSFFAKSTQQIVTDAILIALLYF